MLKILHDEPTYLREKEGGGGGGVMLGSRRYNLPLRASFDVSWVGFVSNRMRGTRNAPILVALGFWNFGIP